jgi:hypothetical protein
VRAPRVIPVLPAPVFRCTLTYGVAGFDGAATIEASGYGKALAEAFTRSRPMQP